MSSNENYKDIIYEICNRAIEDDMLRINYNYPSNYNNYNVKFKSKPWFEKLDKKIQEDTIKECKKIFEQKIYQIILNNIK